MWETFPPIVSFPSLPATEMQQSNAVLAPWP